MKEEILKRLKVTAWGLVGAGLLVLVTFIGENMDLINLTNLSPELKLLITVMAGNIVGQLTKYINHKFSLEEKISGVVGYLRGK